MALEEWEKKKVVGLYQNGVCMAEISKMMNLSGTTVRRLLIQEGVHQPREHRLKVLKDHKEESAIRAEDIQRVRAKVKKGDVMVICTGKGDSEKGLNTRVSRSNNRSAIRRAVVIGTSNARFCTVRLDSGVMDTVMWSDIVMAERRHKSYIE